MKTVLVPLDGSKLAETALDPAARLAARHRARVVFASVVPDLSPEPLTTPHAEGVSRWLDEEAERARRYLGEVRGCLVVQHPEVEVEVRVRTGSVRRDQASWENRTMRTVSDIMQTPGHHRPPRR